MSELVAPTLRLVEPATSAVSSASRATRSFAEVVRRRLSGGYEIDPWGLDADMVATVSPLFGLRYDVLVDHADRLPADGPALLVANRRFGISETAVLVRGLRQATGRHVRVVGAPDVALLGPLCHRLGAVQARPDEVAGLLRAGEVVAVPLGRELRPGTRAGEAPVDLLAPAVAAGCPVLPVGVLGRELGRFWRVRVGEAIRLPGRRGPLAVAELAERARAGV